MHAELVDQPARVLAAAEAVDQQPHLDAAAAGGGERVGDAVADVVVGKDVGLYLDHASRALDRRSSSGSTARR